MKLQSLEPKNAIVIVEVNVAVECSAWGPECTIAQAVEQAIVSARTRIQRAVEGEKSISVLGASTARVVLTAESPR